MEEALVTRRKITKTKKENDVIEALCNSFYLWSPVKKADAISHIEKGTHEYFVNIDGNEVDIHVAGSGKDKYLRTDSDKTKKNNLLELPDC